MTQGQEQEQLLEDASTLLMFASAAARQRLPSLAGGGTEGAVGPESRFRGGSIAGENGPQQGGNTNPIVSRESHATKSSTSQISTHLPPVSPPALYPKTGYVPGPLLALVPPQTQREHVLPALKPLAIASQVPAHIDARLLGGGGYNYPLQATPNLVHSSAPQTGVSSAHPAPHLMTQQGYAYYGHEGASPGIPVLLPRMYGAPYGMSSMDQNQPQIRRQSLAQSPDFEGKALEKFRKTQSASPPEVTATAGGAERHVPHRLVALSPKPAPHNPHARVFEALVHKQDLPARGSFQTTHRRTPSQTAAHPSAVGSPAASPSMATTPYARGINVESGKRSTDNARIAAAALAVAADIPFPLKNNEPPRDMVRRPELSVDTSAKARELGPSMPITNQGNRVDGIGSANIQDYMVTEPEEDENKTEDEPVSSAVRESFDLAQIPQLVTVPFEQAQPVKTESQTELEPETGPPSFVDSKSADIVETKHTKTLLPPSKKTRPPPLDTYKVDPDAGTIGCICGIEEDDGFTIQCDLCFRWQHCSCMGYLTNDEVPEDEYKCYYCDKMKWNKIDPEQCRAATAARLDMDKANDPPEKPAGPKRKTLSSGKEDKKRRRSEKDVKMPIEKPSTEKRKSLSAMSPNSKPTVPVEINNKANPLLEDGATAEPYQGVYYRLDENDYKTPEVKNLMTEVGIRSEKAPKYSQAHETMSLSQYKLIKFSKISLPSHQKYLQERNELRRNKGVNKTTIKVKTYSENPKQKFVSVPKVGLFITEKLAQIASEAIIPVGTVVIEYLGEVDLWLLHTKNKINQYPLWGTVKPRVAKVRVSSPDTGILDFVLDSRFVGNESRFIRRSCATTANCEIRPVYIPQLQTFKFLVVTTQPIVLKGDKSEEELRLPWEWDPLHPITEMIRPNKEGVYEEGKKFEDFAEEEKAYLISCVDTILNFVECGCNTSNISNQCAIFKIKKATSYLLRSNRKASNLGGGFHKSKEELVMPKKIREYISWAQRLVARDQKLFESSPYATKQLTSEIENTPEAGTPGIEDSEVSSDNSKLLEKLGNVKCCKATFKQNLLAQQRKISVTNYEISPGNSDVVDANNDIEELPQRILAIPLTSEVLAKIKSQVNEAFKPLQKITPNVNVPVDVKEVKIPEEPSITTLPSQEVNPVAIAPPINQAPVAETKPPVVKKFSFADYKKKKK